MIRTGTQVKWKWGRDWAYGKVESTNDGEITKEIKGTLVKRKGTVGNKALIIRQDDGTLLLKLEQEVERA